MVAISKAKIYLAVGIEFEKANLKKIVSTNPNLIVVHTDEGIDKISMPAHNHHEDEQNHEEGEHNGEDEDDSHHEHEALDPHIWLSPRLVKAQARIILKALQESDPGNRSEYESNFRQFDSQLDQLNADLNQTFASKKGMRFLVFHPSWGYFAHAYGLEQVPIKIEGKTPKPAQLKSLIDYAKKEKIQVVFVQPQFSAKSAELIAKEIGGEVAFTDPLAEDWMANLRKVAIQSSARESANTTWPPISLATSSALLVENWGWTKTTLTPFSLACLINSFNRAGFGSFPSISMGTCSSPYALAKYPQAGWNTMNRCPCLSAKVFFS